jgi:hypothetical protein
MRRSSSCRVRVCVCVRERERERERTEIRRKGRGGRILIFLEEERNRQFYSSNCGDCHIQTE